MGPMGPWGPGTLGPGVLGPQGPGSLGVKGRGSRVVLYSTVQYCAVLYCTGSWTLFWHERAF